MSNVCGGIITDLSMKFDVSKSVTIIPPNIKLAVAQIVIFCLSNWMVRIADVLG